MPKRKIIIDTDPGIDDAMAIHFAIAHPELEIVGLTSGFGNVTAEVATRNALVLVEMAHRDIPVAQGAARPLVQTLRPPPDMIHGKEGFGDVPARYPHRVPDPRPAWQFLAETVAAAPGEITICAIGRLTNLALALREHPQIVEEVRDIVVMGGAIEVPGNVTPQAEANIHGDPHAADEVFAAGWPLTMVGLDVTHEVLCTAEDFADVAELSPTIGGFLEAAARKYLQFYLDVRGLPGCGLHDPAALIAITDPQLFRTNTAPIVVRTEGAEAGRTVADPNAARPAVSWCCAVDADRVRRIFLDVLADADRRAGLI